MNILVVGGSGFIGTHLSTELHERGHDVTVLSRSPEDTELPPEVERVAGDVTAYDSIEGAFEGKDAVVYLVALSPLFKPKGGDGRHFEVHTEGARNVVDAAEKHDVPRIVHMSALGADPEGSTAYIRSKGEAEEIVTQSTLDYVIFRPSVIFGDGGEFVSFTKKVTPPGIAPLPGGGKKSRFQPIWVGDLVSMLADAVEDEEDNHTGEIYEIGGPDVLTLKEIAKLVRGNIKIVSIPMGIAGAGLKVMGSIPGFPMGADQYRSLKFDNTTTTNDIAAFDIEESDLTTLPKYLERSS